MEAVAAHTGPLTALLDVGAGVGTGTFALAARFADALVTAVDSSADHGLTTLMTSQKGWKAHDQQGFGPG